MASSELSSSEIHQGQGFYHDGKNEAPGVPALPAPLSPSDILLQAEEGMWKKFSSHYEFPLSMVIALGIHVIVVVFVVAFMTMSFYWSAPPQPITGVVEIAPRVNQEGDNKEEREGGGSGNQGQELAGVIEPFTLTSPKAIQRDDDTPLPLPRFQDDRQSVKGRNDKGIGGGTGPGFGPKDGVGVPMARNKRWRIQFSYDEPERFLEQLSNLQVSVALRMNNGRFLVYKNLSASPIKQEEMNDTTFVSFVNQNKQLWFINNDRVSCENFAYAVNLSERPLMMVMIVPAIMEKSILAAELKYHGMTEDEIRAKRLSSSFRVVRDGNQWKVTVTGSEVLK